MSLGFSCRYAKCSQCWILGIILVAFCFLPARGLILPATLASRGPISHFHFSTRFSSNFRSDLRFPRIPAFVQKISTYHTEARRITSECGFGLFRSFKDVINSQYTDELTTIAASLLKDELDTDSTLCDRSKTLNKVSVSAVDGNGIDLEVVICSSSYCWLQMVHARFPYVCKDAQSLACGFDCLCERAVHGELSQKDWEEHTLLPEVLDTAISLINCDFMDLLKETVNKLGCLQGEHAEYIKNVSVVALDEAGFECEAEVSQQPEKIHFHVSFPRKARNMKDLQLEIVHCLEDRVCEIDWDTVH